MRSWGSDRPQVSRAAVNLLFPAMWTISPKCVSLRVAHLPSSGVLCHVSAQATASGPRKLQCANLLVGSGVRCLGSICVPIDGVDMPETTGDACVWCLEG